jgi:uncharacterized SAM-binding protein YcdF (DUF218 family)
MFFVLSKLVGTMLMPSSLLLLAIVAGFVALVRGQTTRARRLIGGALMILALVSILPIGNVLIQPLENRFSRPPLDPRGIDGIILLGGGEDARTAHLRGVMALNEAGERITETAALARRSTRARVLVSGGSGALLPGDEAVARLVGDMLIALGVARNQLLLEGASRTTYENAIEARRIADPKPGQRWLLVTSAWHMPRAVGVFRAANFEVIPWPVDFRTGGGFEWRDLLPGPIESLRRIDLVAREAYGLVAYRVSGRSSALFPAP